MIVVGDVDGYGACGVCVVCLLGCLLVEGASIATLSAPTLCSDLARLGHWFISRREGGEILGALELELCLSDVVA